MSLDQSIAIITGASRGLGRAIAVRLAEKGYQLGLVARNENELNQLAKELRDISDKVEIFPFDLSNIHSLSKLFDSIKQKFPRINVLINNAGIGFYKPLCEHSVEDIESLININLTAPIILNKFVSELMQAQKSGHIINIGSDLAQRPLANMTPYVASKHGLYGMSRSLLKEVKSSGIKVSIINSGVVDSYFCGEPPSKEQNDKLALQPEDLAQIVIQVLEQPEYQLIDELTVHPLFQEF